MIKYLVDEILPKGKNFVNINICKIMIHSFDKNENLEKYNIAELDLLIRPKGHSDLNIENSCNNKCGSR